MESSMELDWSESRWAVKRTKNVEALHDIWMKQPNRAEVLSDPKLGNEKLVILKKDYLDSLIERYKELSKVDLDKKSRTETLLHAIDLLSDLTDKNSEPETLKRAVSMLASIRNNFAHC